MTEILQVPIDEIKPQTIERQCDPSQIDELKKSISEVGILNPLIVAKQNGVYFLVAGKRRLTAARAIGMTHVPCLIMEPDKHQTVAVTLHENIFREDLNPVDEAQVYVYLANQEKMSQRDIARLASKSEAYISQRISLLTWHPDLVEALRTSAISFSVARELAQFKDEKALRHHLHYAKFQGANYRTVRSWRLRHAAEATAPETPANGGDVANATTTAFRPFGVCAWCDADVDANQLHQLHFCLECREALMTNKEAQKKD